MSCFGETWGLEFTPEEIAEARRNNRLLSMELELSRKCNLECVYCYASSGKPLENELTVEEILDAVDQAAVLGARKIIVLGGGEPLVYPHLFRVIDYILEKGLAADLFTNATLIDDAAAGRLADRRIPLVIKMNSRQPEVQDYLAGREGTAHAIQEGIAALMRAGYPDGAMKLGVETIICRQNIEELPELWRWARNSGFTPYVEVMTWQGRAKEHPELEVHPGELKALFETIASIDSAEFGRQWEVHPPLVGSHCARHEYSCTVTADGDVHPCPGVALPVGNILCCRPIFLPDGWR
jgi:MoaA/NifB/PqqE/SkfB family radical SAM enzyme